MSRRGDRHRLVRWLWTSRRIDARLARLSLLPAAGLWTAIMSARRLAYRRGWLDTHDLPLPAVSVGNLSVGGSGKTPVAVWIARHYVKCGHKPGILLRGYQGGDEADVHRHEVPEAVVVGGADREAGARRAVADGADVLVLDDAFQRLDIWRDYNIALVAAETERAVRWPVPAGPWREGRSALGRADAVIVTRKRADRDTAFALADELEERVRGPVGVVHLHLYRLEGLVSGRLVDAPLLAGRRVVAASGIADPDAFVAQVKATGARVQVATWRDHHAFRDEDVAWLAKAARKSDHVIITRKDAVKLRYRWPASIPEPLVAVLDLVWERGEAEIVRGLDATVASP